MIEPLPRRLSLFAALLLLGSSGAVQLFVVVSAPRSGTEWLRLMLAGHPRVCCDGEVLLRLGRRAQRPGGLDIRRALDAFARGAAPEYDDVLRAVWKSNLRRRRRESPRRPPRHRRAACSMAWRCRLLTARRGQHGRVIAEK